MFSLPNIVGFHDIRMKIKQQPTHQSSQSCKRALFRSPNPDRARHVFLKLDLSPRTKFTEGGSQDMRNCGVSKNAL